MNEAKEYDSLEVYHIRDDKKYKQKIEDTLRQLNVNLVLARSKSKRWPSRGCVRRKERSIHAKRRD